MAAAWHVANGISVAAQLSGMAAASAKYQSIMAKYGVMA